MILDKSLKIITISNPFCRMCLWPSKKNNEAEPVFSLLKILLYFGTTNLSFCFPSWVNKSVTSKSNTTTQGCLMVTSRVKRKENSQFAQLQCANTGEDRVEKTKQHIGSTRANGMQGRAIRPSLEPVSFTHGLVACSKEKIVGRIRTTYSHLDKLNSDDATLPPLSSYAPRSQESNPGTLCFINCTMTQDTCLDCQCQTQISSLYKLAKILGWLVPSLSSH